MKEKQNHKERLKEITDNIETDINGQSTQNGTGNEFCFKHCCSDAIIIRHLLNQTYIALANLSN
ncbi:hypothetical protein [Paraliobacillus sp. JSM ZJ581]|uniref:hypothetical protein n=1 Tax=Paraliobacillus sp. JSM ZJ581 TaxID=3342118 RepID=UPI0035A94945